MGISGQVKRAILASLCVVGACSASNNTALDTTKVGKQSSLSFHLVSSQSDNPRAMRLAAEKAQLPTGTLYFSAKEGSGEGFIVEAESAITQDCISSAESGLHPVDGRVILHFTFDQVCTQLFADLTAENIGKRFAVVLNGEVVTAPRINASITGGKGYLEGGFTKEEANELAAMLSGK